MRNIQLLFIFIIHVFLFTACYIDNDINYNYTIKNKLLHFYEEDGRVNIYANQELKKVIGYYSFAESNVKYITLVDVSIKDQNNQKLNYATSYDFDTYLPGYDSAKYEITISSKDLPDDTEYPIIFEFTDNWGNIKYDTIVLYKHSTLKTGFIAVSSISESGHVDFVGHLPVKNVDYDNADSQINTFRCYGTVEQLFNDDDLIYSWTGYNIDWSDFEGDSIIAYAGGFSSSSYRDSFKFKYVSVIYNDFIKEYSDSLYVEITP